ncbi:aminoglycoside phosphotransferase family protein [Kitasatospora cheerisanensis]|uniref:Aminoglycoside phosphotransferase n=1 Tax=Kitasatospora cheerisanensis KCTC 2395 TaxID=1348663 RepID=A0A066Z1C8_9ACTN|nr:aminoglycoside phosphotransferase family protein [Kitasatospora cheerisanensis]KDN87292.1 aminoglycoside phosphotransferase [Kitasatospora cheerisanensis KCTC 2395]
MDEEQLTGGLANAGAVVRRGAVVERPAPPQVAALHGFLTALRSGGFAGAPLPVGEPAGGREQLEFLPGDVAVLPYPEWALGEEALVSVGRLLRRWHRAAARTPFDGRAGWSRELADPAGGPLLCHNDVCVENVVFRGGAAAALIDFDLAAPGRPLWDVAMTARYWVPVLDPDTAAETGRAHLEVPRRLRLFADAYGLSAADRAALPAVLAEATAVCRAFVGRRIAAAEPAFVAYFDSCGGWSRWDRLQAWLTARLPLLERALTD